MDGVKGPRSPRLPPVEHTMDAKTFSMSALGILGAELRPQGQDRYACFWDGKRSLIQISNDPEPAERGMVVYAPGTTAFDRLVGRITQSGWHRIHDLDTEPRTRSEEIAVEWVQSIEATMRSLAVTEVDMCFQGKALVRVRATVAHDSYERLVEVPSSGRAALRVSVGLDKLNDVLDDPKAIGLDPEKVVRDAASDPGVSEFCRFYTERRGEEVAAAGNDDRKRKKLEDEFTPRLDMTLAGLEGDVHRELTTQIEFGLENADYAVTIKVSPSQRKVVQAPRMGHCEITGKELPEPCLEACAVTGKFGLRHKMAVSEMSGRKALPQQVVTCSLSRKRVLADEVEKSAVSDQWVTKTLLKTSPVSRRRAEPEHFACCTFTETDVLKDELLVSQVSGKLFRSDQQARSAVSSKVGHRSEFILCALTGQPLLPDESEICAATKKPVIAGMLEVCAISGRRVLPTELETSPVSGRKALKEFFVASSVSGTRILKSDAVKASNGLWCMPSEAERCLWSGNYVHPKDFSTCALTGLPMNAAFATTTAPPRLRTIIELLQGTSAVMDLREAWPTLETLAARALGGRCHVESAAVSPDGRLLAACVEQRTMLGFKVRHAGLLYSVSSQKIVGTVAVGRRKDGQWYSG
jgi:hypothetical protein